MKRERLLMVCMALLCLGFAGCVNDREPDGGNIGIGDPLPEFTVEMSDGSTVSAASLRGKTAVIMFFNTNCKDCRQELPVVQRLWEIYADDPAVEIVPISREEDGEEIQAYWDANSLSMPYSPQPTRDVYALFARSVIPRIYISDREGLVRFSSGDSDMPTLERLIEAVESAGI